MLRARQSLKTRTPDISLGHAAPHHARLIWLSITFQRTIKRRERERVGGKERQKGTEVKKMRKKHHRYYNLLN